MAHVQTVELASGKTSYVVRWRDGDAFRQRTFAVKREAERHATKVEAELEEGNSTAPLISKTKTFRQVAEDSLAASKGRLKPRTYEGSVRVLARYVYPALGAKRIGSITSADMEKWIAELSATPTMRTGTPLHPSTVKHAYVCANKVFRYAIKHRLISHNPATGTDLPKVQHAQKFSPTFLTWTEVEALVAELRDHAPDDLFVQVAAYTGLRASELLALQIRDVNLLKRRLSVTRTISRTADGWREDSPKSEKSIRSVPFNRRLAADLAAYLEKHPKRGVDDTAPLWPGRNYGGYGDWRGGLDWEKRMDYNSFYRRRFRAAATAIGYPELRFHDLRHTAASIWASDGMKLERVAAALGHADTSTTYKVYLHFFKDDYDEDMERSDVKYQRHSPPAVTALRQAEG